MGFAALYPSYIKPPTSRRQRCSRLLQRLDQVFQFLPAKKDFNIAVSTERQCKSDGLIFHTDQSHGFISAIAVCKAERSNLHRNYSLPDRSCVGWVERSDTHQLRLAKDDGFRCALPILRSDYFIFVSAAISSLPSAVVIVSRTCSPLPPAGISAEMRFPL